MLAAQAFLPTQQPDAAITAPSVLALTSNGMVDAACRNDTIAGPMGRRGDRVGGPYFMHRDDLKVLAPQWLNYTHIMRNDMEVRRGTR